MAAGRLRWEAMGRAVEDQEAECKEAVRGWEAPLAWVLAARYQMALALAASHLSSLAARQACTMALQAGR